MLFDFPRGLLLLKAGTGRLVEDEATGNPLTFNTNVSKPLKSLLIPFTPTQNGTGDPSPENVRPIVGITGLTAWRTGINVWDEEVELGGINSSTGQEYPATGAIRAKNYIPVVPGASYYLKAPSMTGFTGCWYDKDKNRISTTYQVNGVKTAPNNAYFFRFWLPSSYGTTYGNDISFNYPSTDTEYHAYTGESFPVDWTDEAGTVYGGTLDLVTGVLYGTWGVVIAVGSGDETWGVTISSGLSRPVLDISSFGRPPKKGSAVFSNYLVNKSSAGAWHGWIAASTGNFLCYVPIDYDTSVKWKAYLAEHPLVFAYELEEPFKIQLTPEQITALVGDNTIWSDANGDIEVTYLKKG